jgi:hypothetical protein
LGNWRRCFLVLDFNNRIRLNRLNHLDHPEENFLKNQRFAQSFLEGVDMKSFKKSIFLTSLLGAVLLTGCGAVFINEGSKDASLAKGLANPNSNQKKVNVPKEAKVMNNFDDGSKTFSPKLYGNPGGAWMAFSFGGNTTNKEIIADGGANGTPKCAHVFGTLIDKGDAAYPAFTLSGKFKDSGTYDASPFTGLKFYYKSPATDQALKRRFAIGTTPTLPVADGGTCTDGCYNHFGADLSPSPDWVLKSYNFADMKRESGWGSPVTPPDLTDHLKDFINIKWDHSANNAAGSYNIDYYVDEVEFF